MYGKNTDLQRKAFLLQGDEAPLKRQVSQCNSPIGVAGQIQQALSDAVQPKYFPFSTKAQRLPLYGTFCTSIYSSHAKLSVRPIQLLQTGWHGQLSEIQLKAIFSNITQHFAFCVRRMPSRRLWGMGGHAIVVISTRTEHQLLRRMNVN